MKVSPINLPDERWTGGLAQSPVTSTTVVIIQGTIIISNSGGNYAEKDEKKMRTLANGNRVPNHLASRTIHRYGDTVDLMVNWYTIGSNSSHVLYGVLVRYFTTTATTIMV